MCGKRLRVIPAVCFLGKITFYNLLMKQQKEQSMSNKLTKRFVQELENIKASLLKKRGVKQKGAVNQRIGSY